MNAKREIEETLWVTSRFKEKKDPEILASTSQRGKAEGWGRPVIRERIKKGKKG